MKKNEYLEKESFLIKDLSGIFSLNILQFKLINTCISAYYGSKI
jgi:hypothetical protein